MWEWLAERRSATVADTFKVGGVRAPMLVERLQLLSRFGGHLAVAERVDLAVAFASPSKALSLLAEHAKGRPGWLRSIVGISGGVTSPDALRQLQDIGDVRVPDSAPTFHPKVFLFHLPSKTVVWIGSANLTYGGFEANHELVVEYDDDDDGATQRWFNALWNTLHKDPSERIQEYARTWKRRCLGALGVLEIEGPTHETDYFKLASTLKGWPSFVRALYVANRYWLGWKPWSVLGEARSWLNIIERGRAVVSRNDWDDLNLDEYRLLMGLAVAEAKESGYGLLGSMQAAGDAKNVFKEASPENLKVRRAIRQALQPVIASSEKDFVDAAMTFLEEVTRFEGFSGATATRFLTLARPDLGISVNGGSRGTLATICGLPASSLDMPHRGRNARSYEDLLHYFQRQVWYRNPTPAVGLEEKLAAARGAALSR